MSRPLTLPDHDALSRALAIVEEQKQLLFLVDATIGARRGEEAPHADLGRPRFDDLIGGPRVGAAPGGAHADEATTRYIARIERENALLRGLLLEQAARLVGAGEDLASDLFDEGAYLRDNADVAAAKTARVRASGYEHWLLHGLAEGRPASLRAGAADERTTARRLIERYNDVRRAWRASLRRIGLRLVARSFGL